MLEREDALNELSSALRAAAEGAGSVVLLAGEAGVGKTSIVRRFASSMHSAARFLVGSCEPLSSPSPLLPLLDVVPRLGDAVGQTLARTREGAPASELFDSVLAELTGNGRVSVLIFEDLHWADEATLDLVRYLARRLATVRALLVVTYRDDEIGRTHPLSVILGDLAPIPGIERIRLPRLSRAAVAELAAGRDIDVDRLHRVTGGNPFFVTEVLAAAPGGGMPVTVRAAVRGRLARLSEAGLGVVEALAILGTSARPELIAAITSETQEGLADAFERGLLTAEGSLVAFRHELARSAVLDTMPPFRRVELHRKALALLLVEDIDDDQLALVVEHAERAGDDTAVLTYAPLAGHRAAALGAHREAAAHYGRALRFISQLSESDQVDLLGRAHLEYHLIDALNAAADCGRQLVALHRARGDQLAAGDTLHAQAHTLWGIGRTGEARQVALDSVRILEELPPSAELARAYAYMIELGFLTNDALPADRYVAPTLALTGQLDLPDVEASVRFFETVTRIYRTGEGWGELARIRDRATANGWLEHIPRMILIPPCIAAFRHDPTRAIPMLDEAAQQILDRDMWGYRLYLQGCRPLALLHAGDWVDAEAEARAVQLDPRGSAATHIVPMTVIGVLRARRGESEVWPILDEAMALFGEPDPVRLYPVHEARAEAAWLAGDDKRAIMEAQRGLAGVGPTADPWQVGALACWIFRAGGLPPSVPAAEPYVKEMAGDWAGAATAFEGRGLPYEAALARLGGDSDAVRAALLTFTRFGAQPAAARARTRLQVLGERRGTRAPRMASRSNPYGLTSRQLEVHALLAKGMTNSEIASHLFLSRNTVNHHVSAILTKLDVANRAEAARKLI